MLKQHPERVALVADPGAVALAAPGGAVEALATLLELTLAARQHALLALADRASRALGALGVERP